MVHIFQRIIWLILIIPFYLHAHENPKSPEDSFVIHAATEWMQKNQVPGLAIQVYSQGVPHSYYFGVESKKTEKPVSGNTIFEVGSWTKLFTCLLLAEEVEHGTFKLTDRVIHYLPPPTKSYSSLQSITLENLGTYTAGLPFALPNDIQTQTQAWDYLKKWKPAAPVGTHWEYSNVSIGLLGEAIEEKNHQDINRLYRNELLAPMNMTFIGLKVPKKLRGHYAQGYDAEGNSVKPISGNLFPSAWALKMTADDALQFLKASLALPGTSKEIIQAMKMTQTGYVRVGKYKQGLGWVIYPITYPIGEKARNDLLNPDNEMNKGPLPSTSIIRSQQKFDGSALMDKTGATEGFRSYIVLIPNKKSGVVVLANHYVSNGEIIKLGREILLGLDKEVIY